MKRVMLFLITNIAVMLVLSIVYQVVLMLIGPEALATPEARSSPRPDATLRCG